MVSSKVLATVGGALLAPFASAFDAQAKTNVAVYYGQGSNQSRLSHFCHETSLDIINLGFVNVFPDQGILGMPGTNFGNQCDGLTLGVGNTSTQFLTGCHQLAEDIPICQAAGKKVFLSLGGDSGSDQKIESEKSAIKFADFLWDSFGPNNNKLALFGSPRPFGDAVVDGFDFDIEVGGDYGYATMINRLREHFAEEPSRTFYISGAPQCPIPDAQLGDAIANAAFDFVWVQFYNTEGCSARNFVEGNGNPGFNYDEWVNVIKNSANPEAKLLVGLPASSDMAIEGFYLKPDEVEPLVAEYMDKYPETFGGIMLWEATASENNRINGRTYAENMKAILYKYGPKPTPTPTPTPSQTPSSSSIPVSSSPAPSNSAIVSETPVPSSTHTPSSTSVASTTSSSALATSSTPKASSSHVFTGASSSSSQVVSSSLIPSSTPIASSKPTSSHSLTSSSPLATSSAPIVSSTPKPSSSPANSNKPTSSHSLTTSNSVIVSTSQSKVTSSASKPVISTKSSSSVLTTSTPVVGSSSVIPSASSPVGVPGSSPAITPPASVTGAPSATATESSTVTTVIVTSYIDICPTGFTTVTTTYTTTYCPETAVPASPTMAPSVPMGWTTVATVCTHCAPTPTTVTLTLPPTVIGSAGNGAGNESASHKTSSALSSPSGSAPSHKSQGTAEGTSLRVPTASVTPSGPVSTPLIHVPTGTVRASSTLYARPTGSASRGPVGPSGTTGTEPLFTGAAVKTVGSGVAMALAVVLSVVVLL